MNDLAQAHLLALQALFDGAESNVYNLGNSIGHSVRQVIDVAGKVTGQAVQVVTEDRRPGDPAVLVADAAKIKGELNWRPAFEDLEEIIATAWRWHSGSGSSTFQ